MDNSHTTLIESSKKAMETAYAPYSKFQVGAAIELESGKIYTGCNVENVSFGLTCCAERTAIFKAISEEGKANAVIKSVAISVSAADESGSPCGACRQVLYEFSTPKTQVIYQDKGGYSQCLLSDLLPRAFNSFE